MKTLRECDNALHFSWKDEYVKKWWWPFGLVLERTYTLLENVQYISHRYNKTATLLAPFDSDGATGPAEDIMSKAQWVHDWLRKHKKWDDGTVCTNRQASFTIYDILLKENRRIRARTWFCATLAWGWMVEQWKSFTKKRTNCINWPPIRMA